MRMHFSNYTPTDADLAELADYNAGLLRAYREALASMDWGFEQSDDGESRRRGARTLEALRGLQPTIDPDGAIWRAAAPAVFSAPEPYAPRGQKET